MLSRRRVLVAAAAGLTAALMAACASAIRSLSPGPSSTLAPARPLRTNRNGVGYE